ncbi:MAG: Cys-tRNA(Pro) deacylase [Thermoplasmata archaeon]|nr:MAG: Cys-tRNA(Pro) deacylase [Deltaproteobacteria bacterium]RLF60546.1 MAG: Cys-tRNA(Pro) deacylase [Thermoplasmata archaeon]
MAKQKIPSTQAIRELRTHQIDFTLYSYRYEKKAGVAVAAAAADALGVDEHQVVKTLVMMDDRSEPFLVLMHGDKHISTKALARELDVKKVRPCDQEEAKRYSGYLVGGISPFGTKRKMKVYVEASILTLPKMYINAGKRGLLAAMAPHVLTRVLDAIPVNVAV